MKTLLTARVARRRRRVAAGSRGRGVIWVCACAALGLAAGWAPAQSQVAVTTIAGGPVLPGGPAAGYVDGNSLQQSQFSFPAGVAVDGAGNVFVADRDNGRVRKLDIQGDRTSTFLSGLNRPVDVAIDSDNQLFVLVEGEGAVRKYNAYANPLGVVATGLVQPTAIAIDSSTNLYVAELGGLIKRIAANGAVTVLAGGFNQPGGVEVADNGHIVVADTGNHAIRVIDPATRAVRLIAGGLGAGAVDGPTPFGRLNGPAHLAKAPSGAFVVADRLNHKVRVVTTNGLVTTLYGVAQSLWFSDYPGWEDGSPEFAEARDPLGVAVGRDGTVYVSESYYHLIRSVDGAGLNAPGTGGGSGSSGTNIVVTPPSIAPNSGYYPAGQLITVNSPNRDVFYTTDGTVPTTNSFRVPIVNNVGHIFWSESTKDLTSLRVRAFIGTNASVTVGGVAPAANEIGVVRDVYAGPGSTAIIPVVMNLVSNQLVRSLQFRVEVQAVTAGPGAVVSEQLRALPIRTNDFVKVVAPAQPAVPAVFSAGSYLNQGVTPNARGLLISFVGTNANFWVRHFAVVSMLAVPIPVDAPLGARYRINILFPSGTADGEQVPVSLSPMASREIIVSRFGASSDQGYLVGDSSPSGWYNSGDFGNGELNNADVNNAFGAALGLAAPFPFTDAFDSMDAFPADTDFSVGGDGEIRFLDWQIILRRSVRLDLNNWRRSWNAGGLRAAVRATLPSGAANSPALRQSSWAERPGAVWVRQAMLSADAVGNAGAGVLVRVPVRVKVGPGHKLSGLLFSASVTPAGDSPQLDEQARFAPAAELAPGAAVALDKNLIGYGWDLGSFQPALEDGRLLGHLEFRVPKLARAGDHYTVRFLRADGAPDIDTQYDFETLRGKVWVNVNAGPENELISDEWRAAFFESAENPLAAASADADGDGIPNWAEYLAGTDPTKASSKLRLEAVPKGAGPKPSAVVLRWLSAPGKRYRLESTSDLNSGAWLPVGSEIAGDGWAKELQDDSAPASARFYRITVR